jgi:hypothetical protein
MDLPEGRLLRKRVLKEAETVLSGALDRQLTGYARLEPQETLLLDGQGAGILVFKRGVPLAAYHTETDTGGESAVTEIASSGPYRLELYELADEVVDRIGESDALLVAPTVPAKRLAGDEALLRRTREQAPDERVERDGSEDSTLDAVEAFLDDSDRIETIRDRARSEAQSRAEDWGFPADAAQSPDQT